MAAPLPHVNSGVGRGTIEARRIRSRWSCRPRRSSSTPMRCACRRPLSNVLTTGDGIPWSGNGVANARATPLSVAVAVRSWQPGEAAWLCRVRSRRWAFKWVCIGKPTPGPPSTRKEAFRWTKVKLGGTARGSANTTPCSSRKLKRDDYDRLTPSFQSRPAPRCSSACRHAPPGSGRSVVPFLPARRRPARLRRTHPSAGRVRVRAAPDPEE